jgi:hypothetical protein
VKQGIALSHPLYQVRLVMGWGRLVEVRGFPP